MELLVFLVHQQGRRDVFDVNQNFADRGLRFLASADLDFHFHGFEENLVHWEIFAMKLGLFVVDSVENVLEVRKFGDVAVKVGEETFVEDLVAMDV